MFSTAPVLSELVSNESGSNAHLQYRSGWIFKMEPILCSCLAVHILVPIVKICLNKALTTADCVAGSDEAVVSVQVTACAH